MYVCKYVRINVCKYAILRVPAILPNIRMQRPPLFVYLPASWVLCSYIHPLKRVLHIRLATLEEAYAKKTSATKSSSTKSEL